MLPQQMIEQIADQILAELAASSPKTAPPNSPPSGEDQVSKAARAKQLRRAQEETQTLRASLGAETEVPPAPAPKAGLSAPEDPEALERMLRRTPARIGVGRAGPRLRTETLLKLRADHAAACDAVRLDVEGAVEEALGLFRVQTRCRDKNEFITRPDLGRDFDPETLKAISDRCAHGVQVQLIVSDGLSSTAVNANARRIFPVLLEGLKAKGLTVGTPIFVQNGRVAAQDRIAELLDAEVVCSLIGERPGLATAESMSAYISYRATVGMPEARRTVVSNIHKGGIPAVEAGAYIVDVIAMMLQQKASGVDLKK